LLFYILLCLATYPVLNVLSSPVGGILSATEASALNSIAGNSTFSTGGKFPYRVQQAPFNRTKGQLLQNNFALPLSAALNLTALGNPCGTYFANRLAGVSCLAGTVTAINWNNFGYNGDSANSLPLAFSSFTKLQFLILSGNKLKKIPQFICTMGSLVWLDLSSNNIQPNSFPDCFTPANFPNLAYINLADNNLSSFPSSFVSAANSRLIYLDISHNQITNFPSFKNLTALEYLDISSNTGSSSTVITLNNPKLSVFRSDNTPFSLSQNTFDNLPYLQVVSASNCSFLGDVLPNFTSTPNLYSIDLSNNYINSTIPDIWQDQVNLNTLILANNRISNVGTVLSSLNLLTTIDLSRNYISVAASSTNTNSTVDFTSILTGILNPSANAPQSLDLSGNSITGSLSSFGFSSYKVSRLDLSENLIVSIPNDLFISSTLTYLDVSDNQLTAARGIEDFAPSFDNVPSLQYIDFSENYPTLKSTQFPSYITVSSSTLTANAELGYTCPKIFVTTHPSIVIKFDPLYVAASCDCSTGYWGNVPNCFQIPDSQTWAGLGPADPSFLAAGIPLYNNSFTDEYYGEQRETTGVNTFFIINSTGLSVASYSPDKYLPFDKISVAGHAGQDIRVINIFLHVDFAVFNHVNDVIIVRPGGVLSAKPAAFYLTGSQADGWLGQAPDPQLLSFTNSSEYRAAYGHVINSFTLPYTFAISVADETGLATLNFQSRATGGTHFFASYAYSDVCPEGSRTDPATGLCSNAEFLQGDSLATSVSASTGILSFVFAVLGSWSTMIFIEQAVHDYKSSKQKRVNILAYIRSIVIASLSFTLVAEWATCYIALNGVSIAAGADLSFDPMITMLSIIPVFIILCSGIHLSMLTIKPRAKKLQVGEAASSTSLDSSELGSGDSSSNHQQEGKVQRSNTIAEELAIDHQDNRTFGDSGRNFGPFTWGGFIVLIVSEMICLVMSRAAISIQASVAYSVNELIAAVIVFFVLASFAWHCFYHLLRWRFIAPFIMAGAITAANQLVISSARYTFRSPAGANHPGYWDSSLVTLIAALIGAIACFILLGIQFTRMKLSHSALDVIARGLKQEIAKLNKQLNDQSGKLLEKDIMMKNLAGNFQLINAVRPLNLPVITAFVLTQNELSAEDFNVETNDTDYSNQMSAIIGGGKPSDIEHKVKQTIADYTAKIKSKGKSGEEMNLRDILANPVCLELFKDSVAKELSSENVIFYIIAQKYSSTNSKTYRKIIGEEMIEKFFANKAEYEINVPSRTKQTVLSGAKGGQWKKTLFDPAVTDIFSLMKGDSMSRFLMTEQYALCNLISGMQKTNTVLLNTFASHFQGSKASNPTLNGPIDSNMYYNNEPEDQDNNQLNASVRGGSATAENSANRSSYNHQAEHKENYNQWSGNTAGGVQPADVELTEHNLTPNPAVAYDSHQF
jgi:Leucine-rich repeat (LRR) protein